MNGASGQVGAREQLRELRASMPRRPLTLREGLVLADRQATLLRWQLSCSSPAIPTQTLASPSYLNVTFREGIGASGLAVKTAGGWVIVLRSDEPEVRQRFTLAHEIKHVIDDALCERLHSELYRTFDRTRSAAERVCDEFAACLLMPKILLRREWAAGVQDIGRLARRFQVSGAAMRVRLQRLGLLDGTARCEGAVQSELDLAGEESDDHTIGEPSTYARAA